LGQFEPQFFKTKYLTDKDPVLVPTDIAAIVNATEKKILGVLEVRHFAWQANALG